MQKGIMPLELFFFFLSWGFSTKPYWMHLAPAKHADTNLLVAFTSSLWLAIRDRHSCLAFEATIFPRDESNPVDGGSLALCAFLFELLNLAVESDYVPQVSGGVESQAVRPDPRATRRMTFLIHPELVIRWPESVSGRAPSTDYRPRIVAYKVEALPTILPFAPSLSIPYHFIPTRPKLTDLERLFFTQNSQKDYMALPLAPPQAAAPSLSTTAPTTVNIPSLPRANQPARKLSMPAYDSRCCGCGGLIVISVTCVGCGHKQCTKCPAC